MLVQIAQRLMVGAALAVCCHAAVADHPEPLPFSFSTNNFDYTIVFDQSNPYTCVDDEDLIPAGADRNYFPFNQVLNVADALDSDNNPVPGFPPGYRVAYDDLDFRSPDFDGNEDDEVQIYDCAPGGEHDDEDCDNGQAQGSRIRLPATRYCSASERSLRRVTGHEMFHHVQFMYDGGYTAWGKVPYEGTARMMEDHIYADIDGDSGAAFVSESNKYLGAPDIDFWESSYQSALGWKHLAEQYGTIATEPQIGVNFVRRFWDNLDATEDPDVPGTIQQTLTDFGAPEDLREWFVNFTIANIAKEFDTSGLADAEKYQYRDEADGNGVSFASVARRTDGSQMIPGEFFGLEFVERWGADYLDVGVESACLPGDILGVKMDKVDFIDYAILPVTDAGVVQRVFKGSSKTFGAAFVQRSGQDRIGRLIAVLTGGDTSELVEYSFDCGTGDLTIVQPDQIYQVFVGPSDSPRQFIVRTVVSGPASLGTPTVFGLLPEDFQVFVGMDGNPDDEAEVLSGAYVQGEYWLTVQAPAKDNANTFDLHVNLGGGTFSDISTAAVSYETRMLDQMLVIDRSGSMADPVNTPKIDAAKNAARLFVDVTDADLDKVGLASFSTNATLDETLATASAGHKNDVKAAINALVQSGATSIGDGLQSAVTQIGANGSTEGEDWVVLLSDGMENEVQFWNQVENTVKNAGVRVNAIALGADADQVLLQEIAIETGGQYYYVDAGTAGGRAANRAATVDATANRLADVFAAASERIKQHQRFWEASGDLVQSDAVQFVIPIEGAGIASAQFAFNWDDAADSLDVVVNRPDGSLVVDGVDGASILTDDTHTVVKVGDLTEGDWVVKLTAASGDPEYLALLSGHDQRGARLDVYFGQYQEELGAAVFDADFMRGLTMPIVATVTDRGGIVLGADVMASIEHPDGTVIDLPLFDDGAHNDGVANDGVYANDYTRTTLASETDLADVPGIGTRGSYPVSVLASGQDNKGDAYSRIRKGAFQIFETILITPSLPDPDTDKDGMPDRYEDLHECLDSLVADDKVDPDANGLDNISEWDAGLDPCDTDTDDGGETDVSELNRGANPFDPRDDEIARIIDAEVVDYRYEHLELLEGTLLPNANLIRYQIRPGYKDIRVLRSTSANGPFVEVAAIAPADGLYHDNDLINGTTYYYRLQPLGEGGVAAQASHVFEGTPNADPVPPIGSVIINGGDRTTTSLNAILSLAASSDTVRMQISDTAQFTGVWLGFDRGVNWTLQPGPDGYARVYVKFLDAAGNESPTVYFDAIAVVSSNDIATLKGSAELEGATEHGGILVQVAGQSGNAPEFTAGSGVYTLDVGPGTWDVLYAYPGYQDVVLEDIAVVGGDLINLPLVVLPIIDDDADGVADIADNCLLLANADQLDSNGDGFGNACDPDLNNDLLVDFLDVQLLKNVFFSDDADADFTGDEKVNFEDLQRMKAFFFGPPGPSAIAP